MSERLKALARLTVRADVPGQREVLNLENIESGTGSLLGKMTIGAGAGLVAFEPRDVLFSKLRPYLAKSLLVDRPMFGTGELLSLVTGPKLDPRFLLRVTQTKGWIDWATATSYGTKMPRTSWDLLSDYRLAYLPPLDEQRRIADFLDTQVTLLDRAIRLHEQRVDLLGEAAEALIGPTIVSSLSGHSPLAKMNRLLVRMARQPRAGAAMVTAFRDGQVIERSIRTSKGFTDSWTEGAAVQGVACGDVVVHGLDGFAGAIGTSESDGICSPATMCWRPYTAATLTSTGDCYGSWLWVDI